ncbi:MAG TPA: hypothetical protein VFC78_03060 [Tepidisphaeraceae bacterium]|nr:hypothetical protein [Tepidisphaeraceae bacterium]
MRLVVKQYDNDASYIVETDNDATTVIEEKGERQPGKRISAIVEVSADDNKLGMDRVLTAIRAIEADVQKKKQGFEKSAS